MCRHVLHFWYYDYINVLGQLGFLYINFWRIKLLKLKSIKKVLKNWGIKNNKDKQQILLTIFDYKNYQSQFSN